VKCPLFYVIFLAVLCVDGVLGSDFQTPNLSQHDILDASEDSQLAAAIAASLRESEAANPVEACTNSRSSDSFDSLSEMDSDYEKSAGEEATNSNNVLKKANQNNENASPKRKLVKIFPKKTASKLNPFLLAKNRCLTQDSGAAGNERTSAGCGVSCSKVIDSCGEEPTHCGNGLPESPSTAASQKFSIMLRFPDGGRDKFVLREDNTVGVSAPRFERFAALFGQRKTTCEIAAVNERFIAIASA